MSVIIETLWIYLGNNSYEILISLILTTVIQILVMIARGNRKQNFDLKELLFVLNCTFIFTQTLWGREQRMSMAFEIRPFYSYIKTYIEKDLELILQIMMNIIIFIPFGLLLPCCFHKVKKGREVLVISGIISLTIELIQGIGRLGLFETDDIINNVLGSAIGFLSYKMIILKKLKSEKKNT